MALKCFLAIPFPSISDTGDGNGFVAYASVERCAVMENNVGVAAIYSSTLPFSASVRIMSGNTYTTIKNNLEAAIAALFNSRTGRSDGNTITFVWFDNPGILGL